MIDLYEFVKLDRQENERLKELQRMRDTAKVRVLDYIVVGLILSVLVVAVLVK